MWAEVPGEPLSASSHQDEHTLPYRPCAELGAGLALVANIVWRVGGRYWIEDGDLGGVRICMDIPLA